MAVVSRQPTSGDDGDGNVLVMMMTNAGTKNCEKKEILRVGTKKQGGNGREDETLWAV